MLPGTGNDALRAGPGTARCRALAVTSFGGLVWQLRAALTVRSTSTAIKVPIAISTSAASPRSIRACMSLSNLTLTTGGFDAEYGRAQGGIVTTTTREPRTDKWRTATGSIWPARLGGLRRRARRGRRRADLASGANTLTSKLAIVFAPDDVHCASYWDESRSAARSAIRTLASRWSPTLFFAFDNVSITRAIRN